MRESWDGGRDPLAALREGATEPFEAFVRTETPTFLGFFRRLGAGASDAEDLVQEVFLKLFRHADTYQPSGRFGAFAFRVARNAWIDRQRRGALRAGAELTGAAAEEGAPAREALAAPDRTPEEVAGTREEAQRVRAALARLSEGQRLVFELGVVQELPYGAIAGLLGIPEGTVKSRMFHAVRRLRELLEDERREEGAA